MEYLERVDVREAAYRSAFRMPLQWINRPNLDFRGYCGRIAEGEIHPGDALRVLPLSLRTKEQASHQT